MYLLLGCFIVFGISVRSAAAEDLLRVGHEAMYPLEDKLSVLRDVSGRMDLAQVLEADAQGRFISGLAAGSNFGLTRDTLWLRVDVMGEPDAALDWLLEVGNASLDHVSLYLPIAQGGYQRHEAGDLRIFSERPMVHRHHVFPLQITADEPQRLYLRVESNGTFSVPTRLWQADALWRNDQISYSTLGLYFGLLIGLLIYNMLLFLALRDWLYIVYVCFVGALALGQAGLTGLSAQFLWPENVWLSNFSPTGGVAAAGLFATLFAFIFLRSTWCSLKLSWLMPLLSSLYLLTVLAAILGSHYVAAWLLNINSLVFSVSVVSVGLISLWQRQPGSRFFVLAWSALLIGTLVMALHNIGVLPSNTLTANALLIGSGLEMILLSLALADRVRVTLQERNLAQAAAIELKQQMLESLQRSEQLLESKVAERTQALEQANQKLRDNEIHLRNLAYHDALTGLANRKLLADRLQQARQRAQRNNSGFAVLVADLDRFKRINDEHGHACGDELLVCVAQRLSEVLRAIDTVARVGGDEFVLILEGMRVRTDAEQVAKKITAVLSEPVRLQNGVMVTVGVSIGIAIYPDEAQDVERLLSLADRQMYSAKTARRSSAPTALR